MKRFLLIGIAVAFLFTTLGFAKDMEQNAEIELVCMKAKEDLQSFLNSIPKGEEDKYGFKDRNEFEKAKLGKPYQVYALDENGVVSPLGYWRVPVTVGNEFRAFLDIRGESGRFETFGLGAAELAKELDSLEGKVFGKDRAGKVVSKSLLRSFQRRADFVAFNADVEDHGKHGSIETYPLSSGKKYIQDRKGTRIMPGEPSAGSVPYRLTLEETILFLITE